jgi:hypothetical protein
MEKDDEGAPRAPRANLHVGSNFDGGWNVWSQLVDPKAKVRKVSSPNDKLEMLMRASPLLEQSREKGIENKLVQGTLIFGDNPLSICKYRPTRLTWEVVLRYDGRCLQLCVRLF